MSALEEALSGEHVDLVLEDTDSPSNLAATGQNDVLVRLRPEKDGAESVKPDGVWLWAASDNLRLARAECGGVRAGFATAAAGGDGAVRAKEKSRSDSRANERPESTSHCRLIGASEGAFHSFVRNLRPPLLSTTLIRSLSGETCRNTSSWLFARSDANSERISARKASTVFISASCCTSISWW